MTSKDNTVDPKNEGDKASDGSRRDKILHVVIVFVLQRQAFMGIQFADTDMSLEDYCRNKMKHTNSKIKLVYSTLIDQASKNCTDWCAEQIKDNNPNRHVRGHLSSP